MTFMCKALQPSYYTTSFPECQKHVSRWHVIGGVGKGTEHEGGTPRECGGTISFCTGNFSEQFADAECVDSSMGVTTVEQDEI